MSIKSDKWIRRMAEQHRMIEPFAAQQVRAANGQKIVSYGTSSYGYDVRCAREFKIFTNINSTIVDPKAFDPKSFVDLESDVCIIPPNSFALARTVEYFRIPRSTLVVCLGKCVTGDTRVVDAETGAYLPITEMRWGRKTLALDEGELKPAAVSAFVPQGRREVFELRTQAGLRIRATANHPFRMPGGWTPLERLKVGDRIAVARSIPVFGKTHLPHWEASLLGLMISQGDIPDPGPASASADPALVTLLWTSVQASGLDEMTLEGRCGYRAVSRLEGGGPATNRTDEWLKKYGLDAADKVVPQEIFMAPESTVRLFLQALFGGGARVHRSGDGASVEYCSQSRRLVEDVHHLLLRFGIFSRIRETITASGTRACSIHITEFDQIEIFARNVGFPQGSIKQQRLELEVMELLHVAGKRRGNFPTLPKEARPLPAVAARASCGSFSLLGGTGGPTSSLSFGEATGAAVASAPIEPTGLTGPLWDLVSEIVPAGTEEVFDISVPTVRNFLANGIIVHNSTYARVGIVVNVTPLEPEWEGHVTLEFSNTTPLPAKIYANEGVAQMLFFESDEVCETSYKDRGGKYQGQTGVTLPKT